MPDQVRSHAPSRFWTPSAWIGACAFFLIAMWYVVRIGDPMPQADNWTNLDVFLRKAYYQGVVLSDFLWNRGSGDHSQPLNKALLWINARYFGLDFKLEAMVGMAFGLGAMLCLRHAVQDETHADPRWRSLGVVAIAGIFFSLNSSPTYNYSMITLWFALYLGMFGSVVAAWRALKGGSPVWLFAITFAFGIVADDVGYLAAAALAMGLCLYACRSGSWKRPLLVAAYCLAGFLLSRIFYACFQGVVGKAVGMQASPTRFLEFLAGNYGDLWRWWAIPAASGFAHAGTMQLLVGGEAAPRLANILAIVVLVLHAWFWRKAWTRKIDLTGFMAVCVMFFYYAHVAGILYGRVPVFGTDYMNSPRYVSFYQLGVVALLLMLIAAANDDVARGGQATWRYAVPAALVILMQLPIGWSAFSHAGRLAALQERKAGGLAYGAIGTPEATRKCREVKELRGVCANERQRQRFIGFLADNRLSIFSPQFQYRYSRLAAAAAEARTMRMDAAR